MNCNAANCSPPTISRWPTSLGIGDRVTGRFDLPHCTNDFVTWAFPYAMPATTDMVSVLTARRDRSRCGHTTRRRRWADSTQRTTIYSILRSAERAVSDPTALPDLPG